MAGVSDATRSAWLPALSSTPLHCPHAASLCLALLVQSANAGLSTSQGHDASTVRLGLPRPTSQYGESISGTGLLMMTMIVLFVLMVLSIRSDSARERRKEERREKAELLLSKRRDDDDDRHTRGREEGEGGGLH